MTIAHPVEPPALVLSRLPAARRAAVEALAGEVLAHYRRGRRIVALDAAQARPELRAFAADLELALEAQGQSVLRADARDFRDDEQLVRALLDPFRLGGSAGVVLAPWDPDRGVDRVQEWITAPEDAVLVLDGVALQRPEIRGRWSFAAWIDLAGEAGAAAPIDEHYARAARPRETATAVIDLRRPEEPKRLFLDYCALSTAP